MRAGESLDEVALGTGWESHSGFREAFARTFGTSPGKTADAACVLTTAIDTPLGPMIAGATDEAVKAALAKQIETWEKTAARYRSEPETGEGTEQLAKRAKEAEAAVIDAQITLPKVGRVFPQQVATLMPVVAQTVTYVDQVKKAVCR